MSIEQPTHPFSRPTWTGTRAAAQTRLLDFIAEASQYAAIRNYALPENRGVSRLSPYLRHRLVSEQEVITHVIGSMDFAVAEKFIQEVVWRTYWKGSLNRTPSLWSSYKEQVERLLTRDTAESWQHLYEAARSGTTHLPYFNEWVNELTTTGYLHNHVRMWFASIWIFTFKIPWQLGAAFMYHHLLDGDPASNTLSWRWVAGLHTKGKTYLARADNIAKYSEGRWNPRESDLATAAFHIEDELAPTGKEGLAFPPLKPTPNTGLLLTSDDLSIDTVLDLTRYRSVCIFTPQGQELTPLKRSFIDEAIQDALSRIAVPCGEGFARTIQLSSEALSWREANNLDAIEIVAPHVGPLRSAVRELASSLTIAQLPIGFLERSWDSTLFPLCDKGFFTMWERFKKRWATKGELAGTCPLIAL